jgi:hypothetical protein
VNTGAQEKKPVPPPKRFPITLSGVRDASFILIGLSGLIHETFFVAGQRYLLLGIFATMLGVPGALQLDRTLQIRIGRQK